MTPALAAHLRALAAHPGDLGSRLARDPVAFPRRYADPDDAELAAVIAASLAYGRVDLFRPVIARILDHADAAGGPAAFARGFDPDRDGAALRPIVYRWNRGVDLVLLWAALGRVARHGGLQAATGGVRQGEDDASAALARLIDRLRDAMVAEAPRCGVQATGFRDLPRGARTLVPSPRDGSACKRWWMFLRWVARPADGVDLGLWTAIPPRALIVPLDVHVARISRLVGLTARRDAGLRTAREVTAALRLLDPEDPVRFDFALAHLGISGGCRGARDNAVCPPCPLYSCCAVGGGAGDAVFTGVASTFTSRMPMVANEK